MWWTAILWAAAGCDPVPPGSLEDVTFPEGFVLDTARDVVLVARVAPGLAAAAPRVRVALPDGRLLADGVLDADTTYTLRLPAGHDRVVVTADLGGEPIAEHVVAFVPGASASVELGP